jgi:hypothetical protein
MRALARDVAAVSVTGSGSVWFTQRLLAVRSLCLLGILALTGCTTVGIHTSARENVDFGPSVTVRVCLLKAADISQHRAEALKRLVQEEFVRYGLLIEVPWVREWERPGFQAGSIMRDLLERPLEPPCDRLFGFVDRHLGDFAWGLVMPEILGAVDSVTATRGYVVATFGSINQLIAPPEQTIVHEFYHLFGCPHDVTLSKCYPKIAALKASLQPDADFFPGVSRWRPGVDEGEAKTGNGKTGAEAPETFLTTRAQVDAAIAAYLADAAKPKKVQRPRDLTGTGSR